MVRVGWRPLTCGLVGLCSSLLHKLAKKNSAADLARYCDLMIGLKHKTHLHTKNKHGEVRARLACVYGGGGDRAGQRVVASGVPSGEGNHSTRGMFFVVRWLLRDISSCTAIDFFFLNSVSSL